MPVSDTDTNAGNLQAVYRGRTNANERRAAQRMNYDAWGNIAGVEDGNHNQTEFCLDDWGRITEIHTPEGGVERYTYDRAGNITSTTDANGGTITYCYNSMGQVCRITDQEGNSEYFYYDEEGRRETHIDRNGNVERTLYNMDGNLSYQRFEDRKGKNPVVNQYAYYPDGKLKEAVGGGITYRYAYTKNGLLKSKSASDKVLLEYAYDGNRSLTSLANGTENIVYYSYDVRNRLKKVVGGRDELLADYDYDGAGQIKRLSYGNGVQTEYSYRDDGELSSLVTMTDQGQVLLNFDYAYDGNGNCIRKSGETYQNEYAYDRMNRLVMAVQDGQEEKYAYDLVGNRLKKESLQGTEVYHYNAKNQLTHISNGESTLRYLYDKQGNLLEEQGKSNRKQYSYDAANRQVGVASAEADGATKKLFQTNRYDGEGLRYETEENGQVIRFLFDRGELAQEKQEKEEISYVRGHKPISLSRSGKDRNYFVQDEMGSILFLLDQDHEIRKTYRYDAFGNLLKETGDIPNRLTYTGQIYDSAAIQYYLRARFYNPAIGRFMQEDSYRGDGLNLYAYCTNNPVSYYDPSGHIELLCELKNTSATDPYARTDSVTVSGERAIDRGHSYERGVRDLYGDVPYAQRQYEAMINGQSVNGIADNVILGENIAIEAKYVDDWTTSLRNPDSPNGNRPWAITEQNNMLSQAMKYSNAFDKVIYHTNSVDFADYYTQIFNDAGITNFEFIITPVKN